MISDSILKAFFKTDLLFVFVKENPDDHRFNMQKYHHSQLAIDLINSQYMSIIMSMYNFTQHRPGNFNYKTRNMLKYYKYLPVLLLASDLAVQ